MPMLTAAHEAFVNAKYDGIVLAGVGDGNFYKDVFDVALQPRMVAFRLCALAVCPSAPLISMVRSTMPNTILWHR
jgi:hypothetical protein